MNRSMNDKWINPHSFLTVIGGQTMDQQLTEFYPKLNSFRCCSHMNCCQHYMVHMNLHIFIYSFHQIQLKFEITS